MSAEEWQALYQQGLAEMFDEDFCSLLLLTVRGQKPK
jgi:hypothetical protein